MYSADSLGRLTSKTDAVLIFDLDETILSVNSFPYWAKYILAGHFNGLSRRERLALSLRTARILLERKIFRYSHGHAKRQLQLLWTQALEKDPENRALHALNARLLERVRPNMQTLIHMVMAEQIDAILATSAAGEYAQNLGEALGFTRAIASDTEEARGERKCQRVMEMIDTLGWNGRRRIFFTDHEEDWPMIYQCHRVFWFGTMEDAATMQAHSPWAEIIPCHNKTADEIMQLVMQAPQESTDKSIIVRRYDSRASAGSSRSARKRPDLRRVAYRCF
jgi:phosphoserine phosphatase